MTNTITSQNIDLSSWITLYISVSPTLTFINCFLSTQLYVPSDSTAIISLKSVILLLFVMEARYVYCEVGTEFSDIYFDEILASND
jgi:hypothetical protein